MPSPTPPFNVLITGSSSGLGLALLTHYASQPSTSLIIALDITPLPTTLPHSILSKIQFHNINITSESSIQQLAQSLSSSSTPIALLLHCAGVRGLVKSVLASQRQQEEKDVASAETQHVMTRETMLSTFEINTFGTFNVVSAFVPSLLLHYKEQCNTSSGSGSSSMPTKVVVLSSRMGSISANKAGGGYAYRASKAALNAVIKSFSIDVAEVEWCLLHPGRVETGLVEWKEEGAIGVDESVKDCLGVIEGLGRGGIQGNLRFVDRFGVEIGW